MSIDWLLVEDQNERKVWKEVDGTAYQRIYNMPTDSGTADLPEEGDMMPGEDYSMLGPFLERGGISFRQQKGGARQQAVMKFKLLATR
jgi:hypothetical protein